MRQARPSTKSASRCSHHRTRRIFHPKDNDPRKNNPSSRRTKFRLRPQVLTFTTKLTKEVCPKNEDDNGEKVSLKGGYDVLGVAQLRDKNNKLSLVESWTDDTQASPSHRRARARPKHQAREKTVKTAEKENIRLLSTTIMQQQAVS